MHWARRILIAVFFLCCTAQAAQRSLQVADENGAVTPCRVVKIEDKPITDEERGKLDNFLQ